jgi:uncharacterized protein
MHKLAEKSELLDTKLQKTLTVCTEVVCRYDNTAEVILYGSQARGQATEYSDIDLLLLSNSDISSNLKKQIHDDIYEISLENDIVISIIIKTRSGWERPISQATPLYQAIQNEGILVA